MSYAKSYNGNYQRKSYGNNREMYPQNNGYQKRNENPAKKSGATYSRIKQGRFEGATAVVAWRKTRFGLQTCKCFPWSDVVHQSESGKKFMKYSAEVSNPATGTTQSFRVLYNMDSKTIVIRELNLIISPNGQGKTASGKTARGYFGRIQ